MSTDGPGAGATASTSPRSARLVRVSVSPLIRPSDPLSTQFCAAIARTLNDFLDDRAGELTAVDASLASVADAARAIGVSGKHIRPAFAWWGYLAVDAEPAWPDELLRAVASLDLLHAGLLVHDDLIDASDTRRGMPAAHVRFEAEATGYGAGAAVLLGALLLEWSTALFDECGLPPQRLEPARPLWARMRQEVLTGQLLDLRAEHGLLLGRTPVGTAEQIVRYKTALYTIVRPLQLGALLAGADAGLVEQLGEFGIPLGRAFQWRDDLLDVFGDPAATGKPVGQDLRDGKPTLLVAEAFAHADAASSARLRAVLGRADASDADIEAARQILVETGARDRVEHAIERDWASARRELADLPLTAPGRTALDALARLCVERDR